MNFLQIIKEKTDEELLMMVYEFDKWSPEMLNAIEHELSNRKILPSDIISKKQKLIEEERAALANGKAASLFGQIIGWVTIFGFGGIIIGYNYAYSKVKSKYNNETYFKYEQATRNTGKNMFFISILLTSLGLLYRLTTY